MMMKTSLGAALLLAVVVLVAAAQAHNANTASTYDKFLDFQQRFNKRYQPDEAEARFAIFSENLAKMDALNAKYAGKTQFDITQFADMTEKEFQTRVLMRDPPPRAEKPARRRSYKGLQAPSAFDWRDKSGVVTPVYDQGQCGSCWAFSATENIESQWALAGHKLTSLSMQQIVDCSDLDSGCGGGWPSYAYEYVIWDGQETYADYPYTAVDGTCAYNSSEIVAEVATWAYTTVTGDEQEMVNYLYTHGPISVCVDAENWSPYTSGVYMADACDTDLDHCVLAVGYNLTANPPYWIIRNSWNTTWGMAGYMYLEFGKDACGVSQETTSSVISTKKK